MWQQINENLKIETSKPLGKGGFATVYKGIYNNSQEVAVKELKRFQGNNNVNLYFENEIDITEKLKTINNPYLVQIIDVIPPYSFFQQNQSDSAQQQQQQSAFIVMELCSGDLRSFIQSSSSKKDTLQLICIIRSIAEGVKQLHELNILHRDLKPENIFTVPVLNTNQIYYKIGDFGLGKSSDIASTKIGTILYMAPEMLSNNYSNYTKKVDIWALGVILHELLTGVNIFQGQTIPEIRKKIINLQSYLAKRQDSIKSININSDSVIQSFRLITRQEVANLIDAMLQPNPEQRLDIQGVCDLCDKTIVALQKPIDNVEVAGQGVPDISNNQAPHVLQAPQYQLKPLGNLNTPAAIDYINQVSSLKGKIVKLEENVSKLSEELSQQKKNTQNQVAQQQNQIIEFKNEIFNLKNQEKAQKLEWIEKCAKLQAINDEQQNKIHELEMKNQQLNKNQGDQLRAQQSRLFDTNNQINTTQNQSEQEGNLLPEQQKQKNHILKRLCSCFFPNDY